MGKSDLPRRSFYTAAVNTPVNTPVNTKPLRVNAPKGIVAQPVEADVAAPAPVDAPSKRPSTGDRHPPGYMAEYMRKRRAKKATP